MACSGRWAGAALRATTPRSAVLRVILQRNVLDRQRWSTHEELRISIVTWKGGPITADAGKRASAG